MGFRTEKMKELVNNDVHDSDKKTKIKQKNVIEVCNRENKYKKKNYTSAMNIQLLKKILAF